jgi:predicted Zn-dependent protease with MMP-like domain
VDVVGVGAWMKMDEKEFDRIVRKAIRHIPKEIKDHLDNIIISVRKRPSRDIMREMDLEPGEELLGLFRGTPLIERSITNPPLYPDTILLFQEPLEHACRTVKELEEQIEITIVHEVAHFVGMSEERLSELGYG